MSLVLNLIQKDIKNESNFENILTKINYKDLDVDGNGIPDRSTRGFYYERLWDLCIKLGLTDLTNIKSSHVFGNSNKDTINYHENSWSNYSFESYLFQDLRQDINRRIIPKVLPRVSLNLNSEKKMNLPNFETNLEMINLKRN